jgi:hypothetical protein
MTGFYAPQSEDADEDLPHMTPEQIKRAVANTGRLMARTQRRQEARQRYEAKEQRRARLCRMLNNFEQTRRTGGELQAQIAFMELQAAASDAIASAPRPARQDAAGGAGGAGGYSPWSEMREDDNDDVVPMTKEESRAAAKKAFEFMEARGLIKPKPPGPQPD